VTFIDPVGLEVLVTAKRRTETTRWEFAIIAEPGGVVAHEMEAAGLDDVLRPFATKQDARATMRRA
jgi:anti-anti-sigma regulatory factor